jgi:hypothetical protein
MAKILKYLKSKNTYYSVLLILALFLAGAYSPDLIKYKGMPYTQVLKLKVIDYLNINPNYSENLVNGFSSSRYEFNLVQSFKTKGEFQLAVDLEANIYALERHTGSLYFFNSGNLNSVISYGNLFEKLSLPTNGSSNFPPLAMDIHYALDKLYFSVVVRDEKKKCDFLGIGSAELDPKELMIKNQVFFFRSPCISDKRNSVMWGGRITSNESNLFVSIGEQRFDRSGFPKENLTISNQLALNVFGTVLAFNLNDKKWEVFAEGFRNAQGLFWDSDTAQLFEAEHGSFGGDEINLIKKNVNYGWPYESLGKPYPKKYPSGVDEVNGSKNPRIGVDLLTKKFGARSGIHDKYRAPILSWIPGVGAGNLIKISNKSPLIDWRNDLLVAHMGTGSLHRIKLKDGAVILDENISIGLRIRDLIINEFGVIYFSTDEGHLLSFDTFDTIK